MMLCDNEAQNETPVYDSMQMAMLNGTKKLVHDRLTVPHCELEKMSREQFKPESLQEMEIFQTTENAFVGFLSIQGQERACRLR